MKKILINLAFSFCFITSAYSQTENTENRFGLFYSKNFSSQINFNPQIPEDGQFQWNTLATFGIGAYYDKMLGENLGLNTQIIYQVKGYKERAQIAEVLIPDSYRQNEYANTFRYITLEVNPVYYFSKSKVITPFISAGLNGNFLINNHIGSDVYPMQNFYPVNEYEGFRKWSLGYNLSAGSHFNNLLSLEGKFHRDITPILNRHNLQVWNWVWSINFKLNIQQIIYDIKEKRNDHI